MEIEKTFKITQDMVWGSWTENLELIDRGMIVAQGFGNGTAAELQEWKDTVKVSNICPIWKDELPYKSVTVICDKKDQDEVEYWLTYVHGSTCISQIKQLRDGKVAIRSDYMCW